MNENSFPWSYRFRVPKFWNKLKTKSSSIWNFDLYTTFEELGLKLNEAKESKLKQSTLKFQYNIKNWFSFYKFIIN